MLAVSFRSGTAAPFVHCGNVGAPVRSPFCMTELSGVSLVPALGHARGIVRHGGEDLTSRGVRLEASKLGDELLDGPAVGRNDSECRVGRCGVQVRRDQVPGCILGPGVEDERPRTVPTVIVKS